MIIDKNVELFRKAQNGDRMAITNIVENNMGLVIAQAKKYKGKAISFDDAMQVGSLGLLYSIQNYDPELGIKFSTYASSNIIGKIMHTVEIIEKMYHSEFQEKILMNIDKSSKLEKNSKKCKENPL